MVEQKKKGGCCGGNEKVETDKQAAGQLRVNQGSRKGSAMGNKPLPSQSRRGRERNLEAKIILLGDSGVGKSSIASRFCKDRFDEIQDATIGAAYLLKDVQIPAKGGRGETTQVRMHLWDTAGHERFRSMIGLYYKDTVGAIITYDVSNEQSFKSVQFWIDEMKKNRGQDSGFVLVLAGNKSDMPADQIRVSQSEAKKLAAENDMYWAEVSAKTG